MTCDETRDTLSAYLDEALAPDERRLVDVHLAGCAECRRELEALRGTVALLQRVAPERAPVGFVDRVVAAARPRPWYRRVADAVLLPLSVKLPLEAAAVVMVGLLAVYLFERSPELQQAAREVAPQREAAAPAKEKAPEQFADRAAPSVPPPAAPAEAPARTERDRADARRAQEISPPAVGSPTPSAAPVPPPVSAPPAPSAPPASPPSPEAKALSKTEGGPGENVVGGARPEAESRQRVFSPTISGDSTRSAPSAPSSAKLAAKRVLPPADVVARVAVKDRDAAERDLTTLIERVGGHVTQRRREDDTTVVEAVIPQPRYAEFSTGLARIGSWQVEAERPDLPAQVHVILRLQ